jgi:hypothetical protein
MDKHIELIKKIKALAEKGVGGEKLNAEKMLHRLLKKHDISIEDVDGEKMEDYFFKVKPEDVRLFVQVAKSVRYDLKLYGGIPTKKIKEYKLQGNYIATCTAFEFIEIKTMLDHYTRLYKEELDVFFGAFIQANNLFANPPENEMKPIEELTQEERTKWTRQTEMASKIKTETFRRRIGAK